MMKSTMLKNPLYQYGSQDLQLPVNLNFGESLLSKLAEFKERTIVNGLTDETLTYGEIAQHSMNLAVSLAQLGVRKGQTVAMCSENRLEYWSAVIGSICTGATLTAVNPMYTKHEITHVMDISKPKYVVCSPEAYKRHQGTFSTLKYIGTILVFGDQRLPNTVSVRDLVSAHHVKFEEFQVAEVDPLQDTLLVLYSSGTTGLPKGVMLTHLNALISCHNKLLEDPQTWKYQIVTPWFHVMGLMTTLSYFIHGLDLVFLAKYDTEVYLQCIEKYKAQRISVVPPMLVALTKHPGRHDTSSIRYIFSGAAPLTKDTMEQIVKKFPYAKAVLQGYGATETSGGVTLDINTSPVPKPGNSGRVKPGAIMKIVDIETRQPVGPNITGEICIKGGMIMKGYIGKDLQEDVDEEGFFKTGDVGYFDQDGYLFVVDRLKELIKYKGFQVPPAEIEAVLLQHPAVRDAGVVGLPDLDAGEVPCAFVALQPGADASVEELKQLVAERLSNPKWLRGGVRFVPEIPKNPSGKILRRQLKAMIQGKSKL